MSTKWRDIKEYDFDQLNHPILFRVWSNESNYPIYTIGHVSAENNEILIYDLDYVGIKIKIEDIGVKYLKSVQYIELDEIE